MGVVGGKVAPFTCGPVSKMEFHIEPDPEKRMIRVRANGLLTQKVRKEILIAVAGHLKMMHFSKVIIDLTASTFQADEPMIGALELTTFLNKIGIGHNIKLAFLYRDAESHRKFFEQIAQSAGYNLRYFKSAVEAETWLE